jgi:hypothetical protein
MYIYIYIYIYACMCGNDMHVGSYVWCSLKEITELRVRNEFIYTYLICAYINAFIHTYIHTDWQLAHKLLILKTDTAAHTYMFDARIH